MELWWVPQNKYHISSPWYSQDIWIWPRWKQSNYNSGAHSWNSLFLFLLRCSNSFPMLFSWDSCAYWAWSLFCSILFWSTSNEIGVGFLMRKFEKILYIWMRVPLVRKTSLRLCALFKFNQPNGSRWRENRTHFTMSRSRDSEDFVSARYISYALWKRFYCFVQFVDEGCYVELAFWSLTRKPTYCPAVEICRRMVVGFVVKLSTFCSKTNDLLYVTCH